MPPKSFTLGGHPPRTTQRSQLLSTKLPQAKLREDFKRSTVQPDRFELVTAQKEGRPQTSSADFKRLTQRSKQLFGTADEGATAQASRHLSLELREGHLTPEEAAKRLYVDSHVSGLFSWEGWQHLQAEAPAQSVATLTLTDIKPVNDDVKGGHDTANALLAHVASAVAAVDAHAARKGTLFVFRGQAAELHEALKGVRALLPPGMVTEGAFGPTFEAAVAALDRKVDAAREAGTLAARGDTHADLTQLPMWEAHWATAARNGGRKAVEPTDSMVAQLAAVAPMHLFDTLYLDGEVPGVLSAVGWEHIPRKAAVASIDIKGLKDINALGKPLGDKVLQLFAEVAT
jgi:GGDEF domain-containing protein